MLCGSSHRHLRSHRFQHHQTEPGAGQPQAALTITRLGGLQNSMCSRAATPRRMRASARLSHSSCGNVSMPTCCRGGGGGGTGAGGAVVSRGSPERRSEHSRRHVAPWPGKLRRASRQAQQAQQQACFHSSRPASAARLPLPYCAAHACTALLQAGSRCSCLPTLTQQASPLCCMMYISSRPLRGGAASRRRGAGRWHLEACGRSSISLERSHSLGTRQLGGAGCPQLGMLAARSGVQAAGRVAHVGTGQHRGDGGQ